MKKRVSLVLSSGGARGYAHIAVIEELEKAGCEIVSISGSSMGALIGGLYACGKMQEYKEWVLGLRFLDIAKLLDLTFIGNGLIEGEKVFDKIEKMIGDIDIEDLPIKYTAVATDIVSQKEVWFQRGKLLDAIRASIAIPTIFTPKKIEGRYYVDGSVLNPLPIAPTISDNTDYTIAVNVNAKRFASKKNEKDNLKDTAMIKIDNQIVKKFERKIENLIKKPKDKDIDMGIFGVMTRSIDAMQKLLSEYKIAGYSPDMIINIPGDAFEFYEFHKAKEIMDFAKEIAKEQIKTSL